MDLRELTELDAVSGQEKILRRALLKELERIGVSGRIDRMGNLIAVKKGTGPDARRVMVCAHMDEVGMLVVNASSDGMLKLASCGGIDPRTVLSERVRVGEKALPGVIGCKPIHLQEGDEAKKAYGWDDIALDIGAHTREEALEAAPKGTWVAFDTDYVPFGDGFACAKALDDRVGVYNLLRLLEQETVHDLVAVFTVQEEVGCRGARAAAYAEAPDAGLILEGTTCNDLGNVPETAQVCNAGKGVCVSFMDNASVADRGLFRRALALSKKQGIDAQVKRSVTGGNESRAVQRAAGPVPTLVLSVPCRYIHSPSSVVKLSDVESQFRLALALLRDPLDGCCPG